MQYTFGGRSYNFSGPIPESYQFESLIENEIHLKWMKHHWHYSIYFSVIYLILIFSLQHYMKSRPPLDVRRWMITWNALLGVFSICLTLREIDILKAALPELGFNFMICDHHLLHYIPRITFWGWLFIYSKALELLDTVFLALNKKKLMFLHCYHHAATLVLTWYMTAEEVSALSIMGYANAVVHSLMYPYFAFKVSGYNIPRTIAMIITVLQTAQMAIGVLVTIYAYWLVRNGKKCASPAHALEYAFCIYLSYGLLFAHLFYTSYVKPNISRKKDM